jgi:hypothetical protein
MEEMLDLLNKYLKNKKIYIDHPEGLYEISDSVEKSFGRNSGFPSYGLFHLPAIECVSLFLIDAK